MAPYDHILVTGGAGFVGSSLALALRDLYSASRVTAFDNLRRRGSETNLPRLRAGGVTFVHGDVRTPADLSFGGPDIDLIVECSAEPSVLAGFGDDPSYVVDTNLGGTVHCLNLARRASADIVFLSTSRVYPTDTLNTIAVQEGETRFTIDPSQELAGVSERGIDENFPLAGVRTLYGATKLCSELIIAEYAAMYGLRTIVNRCGVIAGPRQMGKVEQGVFALWVAKHHFKQPLSYIGWGGDGKQVRDLLHIDDLARLIEIQLGDFARLAGATFNVGGGTASSLSLRETTELCRQITGNVAPIRHEKENRPGDIRLYITDNERVRASTGWSPTHTPVDVLESIYQWIRADEDSLRHLWTA